MLFNGYHTIVSASNVRASHLRRRKARGLEKRKGTRTIQYPVAATLHRIGSWAKTSIIPNLVRNDPASPNPLLIRKTSLPLLDPVFAEERRQNANDLKPSAALRILKSTAAQRNTPPVKVLHAREGDDMRLHGQQSTLSPNRNPRSFIWLSFQQQSLSSTCRYICSRSPYSGTTWSVSSPLTRCRISTLFTNFRLDLLAS